MCCCEFVPREWATVSLPTESGQQENCRSRSLWDTHCRQRIKAVDTSLPCSTPTHRISIEASGSEAAWNTKVDAPYRAGNKPVLVSHCVRYVALRTKFSPDKLFCPEISRILRELEPSSNRPPLGGLSWEILFQFARSFLPFSQFKHLEKKLKKSRQTFCLSEGDRHLISRILWELAPSSNRPPLGPILRNITLISALLSSVFTIHGLKKC